MRDYIMQLQKRLLDVTGEFPAPPPSLELRDPRSGEPIRNVPTSTGDGQGGPPPPPQRDSPAQAPTASMTAQSQYPNVGADGKLGTDAYPSYEVGKIEGPDRPPEHANAQPV